MDIYELIQFLAPFFAPLLEGAGKATVNASGAAWDLATRIWNRMASGVHSRPAAEEAVQDVAHNPDSAGAKDALAWQVEKLLRADTALREDLAVMWREASAAGIAVTTVTASGERSVAVGRDVTGGSIATGNAAPQTTRDE